MDSKPARIAIVVLTLVLSGTAPGAVAFVATSAPSAGHFLVPLSGDSANVTSDNWAGYVAQNASGSFRDSVTMSAGSWIEPTINCSAGKTTDVSDWVGIDGYTDTTDEQTGSSADCNGAVASYYLWYELYPHPSITITGIKIHSGDRLSAWVNFSATLNKFTMTIRVGAHSFSKTEAAYAYRSSAE
jgi:Peptidase A4 family